MLNFLRYLFCHPQSLYFDEEDDQTHNNAQEKKPKTDLKELTRKQKEEEDRTAKIRMRYRLENIFRSIENNPVKYRIDDNLLCIPIDLDIFDALGPGPNYNEEALDFFGWIKDEFGISREKIRVEGSEHEPTTFATSTDTGANDYCLMIHLD